MRWDKKAVAITFETTIFLVLNLVFILLLLMFVYGAGRGAFVYERVYAKQIALILNNAEPGMVISLDMEKVVEIAEKNRKEKDKIFEIDRERNEVKVSLSSRGGHSFQYFSDYDISGELNTQNDKFVIKVKDQK